jgi:hypothetical protein
MLVVMIDQEPWPADGDMVVAYRRWREMLRSGWRRYVELLTEAGVLWPEGAGDDAARLVPAVPDLPDLTLVADLESLTSGEPEEAEAPGREVTQSSARRRLGDGVRSSSVQHPSLPSSN